MIKNLAISGTEYPYKPLDELFGTAEMLGIKNLELWIPHNFNYRDVEYLAEVLEKKGMNAVVISTWTQLNLPGDVAPRQSLIIHSIKAAKVLGAKFVNTYFGGNNQRTVEQALQQYKKNILPCLDVAAKEGVVITLENEFEIGGTDCTRRADFILELMESIDSPYFRSNFDPCNFYFAGEEPFPYAYNLLKNYIAYIHLKDGMKYNPKAHSITDENFLWKDYSGDYLCCKMGEGAINYEGLFKALLQDGYRGYYGLEPHVPLLQLPTIFIQSLSFIKSHLNTGRKEITYESSSH